MPDKIEHVVLLMLENHSFDQMLGSLTEVYPNLDGVRLGQGGQNVDSKGQIYQQLITSERQMLLDPQHEVKNVLEQISNNNSGFVSNFERYFPKSSVQARGQIMNYYELDSLHALHFLARNFTICDRWFSSLPGPTWPNRFFALSGTSQGLVDMPESGYYMAGAHDFFNQTQTTLFDRLDERGIPWRVYYHDFPVSVIFNSQRTDDRKRHYHYMDRFLQDVAGSPDAFPKFSFIEPRYSGLDQNDDHPPHDVWKAQNLIAEVYNAIRSKEDLWKSTLLVVTYDEHGGFYDHVSPPAAVPPDTHTEEYTFDQYGVRVPALLISPWVGNGVDSTQYDHTSLLKYLQVKWGLGDLGNRTSSANPFQSITSTLRTNTPLSIPIKPSNPQMDILAQALDNGHVSAIAAFLRYLAPEGEAAFMGNNYTYLTQTVGKFWNWI